MTADKDFKHLVRAFAREHGLSYASARSHLRESESHRREEHRTVRFEPVLPILRVFDETKAKQFYIDYLGMTIDWEHRFDDGMPLYMQVSRGALVLHLSEHHGDGTPGTHVLANMDGIADLCAELAAKAGIATINPGLEHDELGTWMKVTDPFGNQLGFRQATERH